ncbi:D-aminopeptidase [Dyadobacter sp. CECT 9623]|uniref:D-aminopeptidase n=1 Tax=Dyadobacter linearis TaxID=2823330 RepID=A0ABM8UVR9_9BACT|nr:serine hydrolase [Dyadobacter sp. CECT 9623]CAG5072403.1 D-aminopeptidase [Dyadobacter sp. CECT 9623]
MMEKVTVEEKESLDRVDGAVKVAGVATYSAEYQISNLAHAVLVTSTIAKGTITGIATQQAETAKGVLAVISHLNSPLIPGYPEKKQPAGRAPIGTAFRLFYDHYIYFDRQPVAMVVAETLEQAKHAASLMEISYQKELHSTDFEANAVSAVVPQSVQRSQNSPFKDYERGDTGAIDRAEVKIENTYTIPTQHHQPLEPHAVIAVWEAEDRLTVYDKNQGVKSAQGSLAQTFKLPRPNVKVISPFIGGAFGSGIRVWPHTIAAVLAAKHLKRPVKLVLGREQMFTSVGYRPYTVQKVAIGANREGKLTAIVHEGTGQTSQYEEHLERTILAGRSLYACPNVVTKYRLLNLDVNTPTWMRGPGDATGMFALESALDELSYALKVDPLELRLRNYAETDPERNLPFSAKSLRQCYEKGAAAFGWKNRQPEPGSMKNKGLLVGYGMASSLYGFHRHPSLARAVIMANGTLVVQSATMDIGPGTGTAMTRIASEVMNISPRNIRFDLGDSSLPDAPGQNGSSTIPSVGSAVHAACESLKNKLAKLAAEMPGGNSASYQDILKFHKLTELEAQEESKSGPERDQYSMYSFGCHFIEVNVNPLTMEVKVTKAVTCADVGKIINHKTARSQSIGGLVGGIGMALMEASVMDHRFGRYVTSDFASYHIPVHSDIPQMEVMFIDEPDMRVNPIGSKGLGEIAIVGVAAAVANAVFHATGKRVRELPITVDKLIAFLMLIVCLSGCSQKKNAAEMDIDKIFKQYNSAESPGCAVAVVERGKVVFTKGYGTANLEYGIPITRATVFDIASVSKQFAGLAISTLVQEGKISLDDDIRKYLPEVPKFKKTITIGHLVHHTSGLRDWPEALRIAGWRWDEVISFEDIMRMIRNQRDLDFEPGEKFSYCNTGYNLLAAIVEKVSGQSFTKWTEEHIFRPLNMKNTWSQDDYTRPIKNVAYSYSKKGDRFVKVTGSLTAYGSSSLFTSVEDLSKWVIHFNKEIADGNPVYTNMLKDGALNNGDKVEYAFGLARDVEGGLKTISHTGGWQGYRTIIMNYPEKQLSVILLSNSDDFSIGRFASEVAALYLQPGKKVEEKVGNEPDVRNMPVVKLDTALARKYTGTYELGPGWAVTFTLENGKLMVQATGEPKFPVEPKSDSLIWIDAYSAPMTFVKNSLGNINMLKYKDIKANRIYVQLPDRKTFSSLAGSYYSPELLTEYKVDMKADTLRMHHMRNGDFELIPDLTGSGQFSSRIGSVSFVRDSAQKVTGLTFSGGRVKNLWFKKQ